jgi:hypothetical protein
VSKYVRCENKRELGRVLKFLYDNGAGNDWMDRDFSRYVVAALEPKYEEFDGKRYWAGTQTDSISHFLVRVPRRYLKNKGYDLLMEAIKEGRK